MIVSHAEALRAVIAEMRHGAYLSATNGCIFSAEKVEQWANLIEAALAIPSPATSVAPIPLNAQQEQAVKEWAADDRLWTTQDTVEFNLRTFARVILAAIPSPDLRAYVQHKALCPRMPSYRGSFFKGDREAYEFDADAVCTCGLAALLGDHVDVSKRIGWDS